MKDKAISFRFVTQHGILQIVEHVQWENPTPGIGFYYRDPVPLESIGYEIAARNYLTPENVSDRLDRIAQHLEDELSDIIAYYHDTELDGILATLDRLSTEYCTTLGIELSFKLNQAMHA